jgi:hypothetical protein
MMSRLQYERKQESVSQIFERYHVELMDHP